VIEAYRNKIDSIADDIAAIEREERAEKEMLATESQLARAQRVMGQDYAKGEGTGDESTKRAWFQTHRERMVEKGACVWNNSRIRNCVAESLRLGTFERLPTGERARQKKLAELGRKRAKNSEDNVDRELRKTMEFQARNAKRQRRPERLNAFDENSKKSSAKRAASSFIGQKRKQKNHASNLVNVSAHGVKRARHGPTGDTDFRAAKIAGQIRRRAKMKRV
jgi:ATP-dependent RNA helicase DDX27